MFMSNLVILVGENDEPLGIEEKMKAHLDGKLHRAFSIFILNSRGEMLLQKRARIKYHSGGLWTNACCSHPKPGEEVLQAAHRRLEEEMGFDCNLDEIFQFTYKVDLDNSLKEHEYDHVLIGKYDGDIKLNLDEAEDFKWIALDSLIKELELNPNEYTEWFKIAINKVIDQIYGD